ncbi:MAG: hypothetical protein MJE63_27085 [Proteobacteria bacterium]|nr:hypothetical protein [Pseudomonadota bacterium]
MTPQDIVDIVEARFPILLYQGYRLNETVPVDGGGLPILWPKELDAALAAYSTKAGVRETMYVQQADIDPVEHTLVLPVDFLRIENIKAANDGLVKYREGTQTIDQTTIRILTLLPDVDLNEYVYPLSLEYYMNLAVLNRDEVLPEECDVNLVIDYLEAIVGIANGQMCKAMESLDLELQQRTLADYLQQKKDCEASLGGIRIFPVP